jgi:uncharacterized protein (DUF305 family)
MMMPGMLTKSEDALKKPKGAEFDRLFLCCMIQHHNGVAGYEMSDTTGADRTPATCQRR